MANTKRTSKAVASKAAKKLQDDNASAIQRSLAGAALAQHRTGKQTGAKMEDVASRVLSSDKYNKETKELAGSVLSQSNKGR